MNELLVRIDEARRLRDTVPESQRPARSSDTTTRSFLPSLAEYRTMSVGVDAAGGYLAPEQQSTLFFDRLRANSIMLNMGIRVLPMASMDLNVPGLSGSATAGMFAENAEITASDLTLKAIKLTAHKLGCVVVASREVLADASPDLRAIISQDLTSTMGLALDNGLLSGDGAGANLQGLRTVGGTVTTLGTGSGAVITLDDIAGAISRMRTANGNPGAIVMHPRTEAQVRLLKDGDGHYIWQPSIASDVPARLFGIPIFISSQISITENVGGATKSWLGVIDPSQLVVGQRATVELLYDPYSKSTFDQVLIRATARFAGLGLLNAGGVEIVAGLSAS
jgi:HK97 family phage major capsid protein